MDSASSSPPTHTTRTPSRRAAALAVAALVALSLALRWFGLGCQLPQFVPVDSLVLASEVEVLRHGGDPSYRLWPNLYPRVIPELVRLLPTEKPDDPPPRTLEEHLARARAPFVRVGIVVAILSVLLVPGTYLLARRFLERSWSLVAAALAATSVLFLWFSQQGRPHGAATSMILLAVLASLGLRRKPTISSYVLAGLALGAAIGTLQSGVAALLPFAVAFLLRSGERASARIPEPESLRMHERESVHEHESESMRVRELESMRVDDRASARSREPDSPRSRGHAFASPWFALLSLAIVGLLALALYPSMAGTPKFHGAPPGPGFALRGSTVILMGHAISLPNFNGDGFTVLSKALWGYDPLITATFVLGAIALVLAWVRARKHAQADPAGPSGRQIVLHSTAGSERELHPGSTVRRERQLDPRSATRREGEIDPRSAVRRDLLVVLAFAVPYAAAIGLYHFSGQRFLLPLLPYLACVAAFGLRALWRVAAPRGVALRFAAAGLVAAVLAVQGFGAAKLSWIRSRPDTATEAATWLREHLPSRSDLVLLTPGFDLPLLLTPDALARNEERPNLSQRWYAYQVAAASASSVSATSSSASSSVSKAPASSSSGSSGSASSAPEPSASSASASSGATPAEPDRYEILSMPLTKDEDKKRFLGDPAGYVRDLGGSWIVIEARRRWEWRGLDRFRGTLGEIGDLAARFEPDDAERYGDAPIAHQGFDPLPFPIPWFRRILGARCTGSVLEIWRIRR